MKTTLIALSLALVCCAPGDAWANEKTLAESDLKKLERSIARLQKKLGRARSERADIEQQIKQSESEIGGLQQRISRSQRQRERLESDLANSRQQRITLQNARAEQEALIAAQLRRAYQLGLDDSALLLLNQQNPAQVSRAMTFLGYFNHARAQEIERFSQTIGNLSATESEIVANSAALNTTLAELNQQQGELRQLQRKRQAALDQLASKIRTDYALLQQQKNDRKDLEKLIATLQEAARALASGNAGQPFATRKGEMIWPVSGKRVNRFGARRTSGGLQWEGIEIEADQGTPVRAIHQGQVLFADWFRGQGLLIILDHGEGYLSLYSHNHSLLHETGDWVDSGEAVATVGASGGRERNAVYFEIRHQGKASNPARWCKK